MTQDNRGKPCSCCGRAIQAKKSTLCYSCWSTECEDCPKKKPRAPRKTRCVTCGKMKLICRKHVIYECSTCGGCELELKLARIKDPIRRATVRKKSLAH